MPLLDNLKFERKLWTRGFKMVAGTDEAGRGPLAGPVVAAAVIFRERERIEGVTDSKQLSEKERDRLFDLIRIKALCYGVGIIDQVEIDKINILNASLNAATRDAVLFQNSAEREPVRLQGFGWSGPRLSRST